MKFTPHQYQITAKQFILDRDSSALWLDMGLGKTATTLLAITKMERKRVLIVAPLRVAHSTWPNEIDKWEDFRSLSYTVIKGGEDKRAKLLTIDTDIHLVNYEQIPWLVETWQKDWPYDVVVFDELSKMKSPSSKRFKAFRKILKHNLVKRVVGLTGTPAPNGMLDLWSQTFLLDRGERLGRAYWDYRKRWFNSDYMGYNWEPKPHTEKEIYERLSDICLSMSAEDYLSMPERIDNTINIELPKKARETYDELEKDFITELGNETLVAPNAAAAANKCLQACNGSIYTEEKEVIDLHGAKLDALEDVLEEAAYAPVLVAYNYKFDAARIQKKFKQAVLLDKDPKTIERWNNGDIPLLLAHPASAGHGLNLQAGGNIIVWYGLSWSLENYQQFNARLHRQGQVKPIFVHHIIAEDSIDEKVLRVLGEKEVTQNGLLRAMKKEYLEGIQ